MGAKFSYVLASHTNVAKSAFYYEIQKHLDYCNKLENANENRKTALFSQKPH